MIEVKNVTKKYKNKTAVNEISLTVNDGEIFGFIGHNGAGKTTLIKTLTGIDNSFEGDVLINSISIKENPIECKKQIAYIPDNPDIYQNIKGIDYLNFISDIYEVSKSDREERIKKYSELFEIEKNLGDLISSYSHGMKQKLVIISSLIHEPKILILDEPFVGLDPKSSKTLKDLMRELKQKKVSIFFSSHVLEVVEKLCDRIGIIKNGNLIAVDVVEKIKGNESLEDVFLEITNEK